MSEYSVSTVVAMLQTIAEKDRRYRVPEALVQQRFGISAAEITSFCDAGLPASFDYGSKQRLFDWSDLHFVAARLPTNNPIRRTTKSWASTLAAAQSLDVAQFTYRVYVRANDGPSSNQRVSIRLPASTESLVRGSDGFVTEVTVGRTTDWPIVSDPRLHQVLAAVEQLELRLPPGPPSNSEWFRTTDGLVDCLGASRLMLERCMALGVDARMKDGLLLAEPLATTHTWIELLIDDQWVPVDPLLIGFLTRTGLSQEVRDSNRFCIGAILLPLHGRMGPVVTSDSGESCKVSIFNKLQR